MTSLHHSDDVMDLVSRMAGLINNPTLGKFIRDLPKVPEQLRDCQPRALPVLAHLDAAGQSCPPASRGLLEYLLRFRETLFWGQTYNTDDFGAEFLLSYGWTEFAGPRGPIPSEKLACGVLILGPMTEYPAHSHQAEEVYVPLSGTALWKMGASEWTERAPLEVIYHQSWTPHAMRTGKDPLIALYLWRGGDLKQKSKIGAAVEPRI